jgi:hypothetical protein
MFKKLFLLTAITSLFSCSGEPDFLEGGIYTTPRESGGFVILKILKIDDGGVHVRVYSNIYPTAPTQVDETSLYLAGMDRKPSEALGMGHLPLSHQSFKGWKAHFIQQAHVSKEELEGYQMWLEANGGYF